MDLHFLGAATHYGCGHPGTQLAYQAFRQKGLPQLLAGTGFGCRQGQALESLPVPRPTCRHNMNNPRQVLQLCHRLERAVAEVLGQGGFPFMVGGDHSVTMGSLAGLSRFYAKDKLALVWVDAHTDINTPATTPSRNMHGMSIAAALGLCGPLLSVGGSGSQKLLGENVHIICARSIDPPEYEIIRENGVNLYTMQEIRRRGLAAILDELCAKLAGKAVYLSFDVDVLEGRHFRATGLPVPDGPSVAEVQEILCRVLATGNVAAMDCVEYNPTLDDAAGSELQTIFALLGKALQSLAQARGQAEGLGSRPCC